MRYALLTLDGSIPKHPVPASTPCGSSPPSPHLRLALEARLVRLAVATSAPLLAATLADLSGEWAGPPPVTARSTWEDLVRAWPACSSPLAGGGGGGGPPPGGGGGGGG